MVWAGFRPISRLLLRSPVVLRLAVGSFAVVASDEAHTVITNWSGTHTAHPKHVYYPESLEELEQVIRAAHQENRRVRPIGSGLSPNGIAFTNESLVVSLNVFYIPAPPYAL
eukprot:c49_g1_i1.p1 GENE.c49_g1_i1~~c49_g1_i1.p1  ORF type:complete len:112 (-),score=6.46 c49_g1_i1:61-396(-)